MYHVSSCHNNIHRLYSLLCIRWKKQNFNFIFIVLVKTYDKIIIFFLETYLPQGVSLVQHGV